MIRIIGLAIALAFFTTTSQAAPGLKDPPNDFKKLQGEWILESWVQIGQAVPMKATWTIKGEKYTLEMPSNVEEGEIKLDSGKKIPTMDLIITGGNCKGKNQPGIYKLEGDSLTLSFAWPGVDERPSEFTSTAENRWILITLKRKK